MSRFGKKLRKLWRRRQLEHDLEDEFRFHLELKAELTGDRADAQRAIGNVTTLKEVCRELWSFRRLETYWQDVRFAVRILAKTPGLTLVAVVALALGLGADTAVFTIASGAFSWNLGLEHVDRVVLIGLTDSSHREGFGVSYSDFRDLRSQTKSLAGLAAYRFASVNLSDTRNLPERSWCAQMSANGFFVSEQTPVIGRSFLPEDESPGAPLVVVLTHHVWQDRYGKDPSILGKVIRVNGVPRTVVGVMPPGKRFPEETDLWTPLIPDAQLERRDNRDMTLFGRLGDDISIAAAQSELSNLVGHFAGQYPSAGGDLTADVQSIAQITGAYNVRPLFAALWAAVGFVLLIACADVANILLARGAGRTREISIRMAIGAGRIRIVRQLLIESALLSITGGFLGWLVALGGLAWFDAATRVIVKPVWLNLRLDTTAFTYLAIISITTGLLVGLAPALRLARVDVHTSIKDGGAGVAGSRRVLSVSSVLVVFEMALCTVLLAGAGLMIRSAVNLYGAPLGVNTSEVLTMRVNLPDTKYPRREDEITFHRGLKERLESLPGVEAAAIVSHLPLGGWAPFSYQLEGTVPDPDHLPRIGAIIASSGYFRVMKVQPRHGRAFTELDGITGAPVVIVNESFAMKFWPAKNALGQHLRLRSEPAAQPWLTVVGVLPNVLQNSRKPTDADPLIYLPYSEEPQREMFIVARAHVTLDALANAFRHEVQTIDRDLPVYQVRTLEQHLAGNRLEVNLLGGMFSVFAAIALVLASIGLYAVIAHSISQRTQEIGVRMAIGGTHRDILRLVYAQGMRPLVLGMAVGLPTAFGVTRILRMVLIGVSPEDPLTFLAAMLVLTMAGALGCALPAQRAVRVDPIVALRYE